MILSYTTILRNAFSYLGLDVTYSNMAMRCVSLLLHLYGPVESKNWTLHLGLVRDIEGV
jgi:hypothetical protein